MGLVIAMRSIIGRLNAPSGYSKFCGMMALVGWLPFIFDPPMIHGGTLASITFDWASWVLGGYCSIELVRSSPDSWRQAPALIGCIIYGAGVAVGLYFAFPYIPQLFGSHWLA